MKVKFKNGNKNILVKEFPSNFNPKVNGKTLVNGRLHRIYSIVHKKGGMVIGVEETACGVGSLGNNWER